MNAFKDNKQNTPAETARAQHLAETVTPIRSTFKAAMRDGFDMALKMAADNGGFDPIMLALIKQLRAAVEDRGLSEADLISLAAETMAFSCLDAALDYIDARSDMPGTAQFASFLERLAMGLEQAMPVAVVKLGDGKQPPAITE
jgi:hypothetical protein